MEGGGWRLASEVEKALLRRRFGNARDARRIGFYDSGRRRPSDVARPGRGGSGLASWGRDYPYGR